MKLIEVNKNVNIIWGTIGILDKNLDVNAIVIPMTIAVKIIMCGK